MDATGGAGTPACEECGSPLPGSPKFCPECGARVAASPSGQPAALRKTVTLLFTDVTGSTAMGEQLDPEAYRGIMGRYFDLARTAVERHGGTVEKFVGDAVLAVFGIPEVREDDALRAVRAAVELNRAVTSMADELRDGLGVRLEIRTGINTGAVVTGASRAGGSFATGDAVNTAARLEQGAAPGAILLGEETWHLVRDAVDVEPVAPLAAKGKAEPLPAYRLVCLHTDMSVGRARRTDTTLMGRQQELRVLDEALERTVTRRRSHLVTVVGAPGMGKSRLLHDWASGLEDRAVVAGGRCVSYGQGITYWPIVQVLRQAIGLTGHESEEVSRHAVVTLMGASPDADQVAGLLLPLLGQSGEAGDSDRTVWAVRRALEQLASRQPLVVTVDDLHWAEPTLLDLLERVRDEVEDLPLLLVCQARPELLDQHPEWGGGSLNSVTVGLEPLTADDVAGTLASLMGGPVDEAVARDVAERSGGNPLFVEEIAAHLVDLGLLAPDPSGRWSLTGELSAARIPPTVSALLAARLDRLPPEERAVLEQVSVVGLEFTAEEAEALAGHSVTDVLARLIRRDLLRRVRGAEADTFAFKHILVRDAAYERLPKADRARLHEAMAARIEADGSATGAEAEAFEAHHLEAAVLCRRELGERGPALDDLTDRAVSSLLRAGLEASEREDDRAGATPFRRAVDLEAPTPSVRRRALALLAMCLTSIAQVEAARAHLEVWRAEVEDSTPLDRSLFECLDLTTRIDSGEDIDPAVLIPVAQETARLAREAGDRPALIAARQSEASAWMERAQWERAREVLLDLLQEGGPARHRFVVMTGLGVRIVGPTSLTELMATVDEIEADPSVPVRMQAPAALLRALVAAATKGPASAPEVLAAERLAAGSLGESLMLHNLAGMACSAGGLREEAMARFGRGVDICERSGDHSRGSTMLAWQLTLRLELEDGVSDEVRRRVEVAREWTSPYDVMAVSQVALLDALIAARDGDLEAAQRHLEASINAVDESDQVWQQADHRRWLSEVPRRRGDRETERGMLAEAAELYLAKGMTWYAGVVTARLD